MKRLFWLCCIVLIGTLLAPCSSFSLVGHMSNSELRFECIDCHYEGIGGGLPIRACDYCHNSTSAPYTYNSTIGVGGHNSDMTGLKYGEWAVECVACHDPHNHNGMNIYDGILNPSNVLVEFIAHDAVIDPVTLTTTFTMTDVNIIDNTWADRDEWGTKTSDDRGLLFVWHNPLLDKHYWIEVISATEDTITINAPSFPRIPRFDPDPIPVKLVYGMLIQDEVGPNPVVYSGPSTMADNDGLGDDGKDSTPDGICQVCHVNTSAWNLSGSGANHFNGWDCIVCHRHENGFKFVTPRHHHLCAP